MGKAMEKQQSELQLDKSRVTLLLEINAELLREVLQIQPKLKTPEEAKNDPAFREFVPLSPLSHSGFLFFIFIF